MAGVWRAAARGAVSPLLVSAAAMAAGAALSYSSAPGWTLTAHLAAGANFLLYGFVAAVILGFDSVGPLLSSGAPAETRAKSAGWLAAMAALLGCLVIGALTRARAQSALLTAPPKRGGKRALRVPDRRLARSVHASIAS